MNTPLENKHKLRKGDLIVEPCTRPDISNFIESNHYSGSINGVMASYCFRLLRNEELVGAMLYGSLGMANAWRKYADKPEDVIELRRLCLIDDTPSNSESFFIGNTIRWLQKNTNIKTIVSYADPNYGHSGVIYKATNFEHIGMTSAGRVIIWNGKKYHDKAIRTKYKGELKPFAVRLRNALESDEAHYEVQLPKHIYVKTIR